MKTAPYAHQEEARRLLAQHGEAFALGAEQGTGKTWMLLADMERLYSEGAIQGALIIAPHAVHSTWAFVEAPRHLSIPFVPFVWESGAGVKKRRAISAMLRGPDYVEREGLVLFCMSFNALNTPGGFGAARTFLQSFRSMAVIDESHRIKNPKAQRTQKAIMLRDLAPFRRIASGTLSPERPLDLFSQYEFLRESCLGFRSFRGFATRYAQLVPSDDPLMTAIRRRTGGVGQPLVVAQDAITGQPIYRNLDELAQKVGPITYRVRKEDCLDLPEKVYRTISFELSESQRAIYDRLRRNLEFELPDGTVDIFALSGILTKLQQATSGFIISGDEPVRFSPNPDRLAALLSIVEDIDGPFIVWARFREEIAAISDALEPLGVAEYHGGTPQEERMRAVSDFQEGRKRVFLATAAAAGRGITLTAAKAAIYYSNTFSLEERMQSEDRCHRIGTRHSPTYIDIVASDTVDVRIAEALQSKRDVVTALMDAIQRHGQRGKRCEGLTECAAAKGLTGD
jgi:SNF2 family DNA or RNA helicase